MDRSVKVDRQHLPGLEQLRSSFLALRTSMGKQCTWNLFIIFFALLKFSCFFKYSHQTDNCGFLQWVDPPAIEPYQRYIDYLEDLVIYNMKQELKDALASPNPPSSTSDSSCCTCSTYTCECHKKNIDWSPPPSPPPPPPEYYMPRSTPVGLCSPGSTRKTRLGIL
jgi:hypothetical protein